MVKHCGVTVECVQTDNGSEFTNRFTKSKRDLSIRLELTAARLGIRHILIRPYTPRHNGKRERSHREDQKRFYNSHRFFSLADFGAQLAVHQIDPMTYPCAHSIGSLPKKNLLLSFLLSLSKIFGKPIFL